MKVKLRLTSRVHFDPSPVFTDHDCESEIQRFEKTQWVGWQRAYCNYWRNTEGATQIHFYELAFSRCQSGMHGGDCLDKQGFIKCVPQFLFKNQQQLADEYRTVRLVLPGGGINWMLCTGECWDRRG